MKRGLVKLALSSGAAVMPTFACAQSVGVGSVIVIEPDLDRNDVAGGRLEPDYSPRPVVVGPLLAEPSVSMVGGFQTNLFNRPDAQAAASATVNPALKLRTNASRHELRFSAMGALRRYSRYTTENSEQYTLEAGGRFDLGARQAIRLSAQYAQLIEPRSSVGSVPDAAEPVSFRRLSADVGAGFAFGAFRVVPRLRYEQLDYNAVDRTGGGSADQSFRDTRTVGGELRLEYEFSGLLSGFAAASYDDVASTSAPAALQRDSRDYTVVAGLRGELSPVISGEASIGYRSRDYDQPAYRDFSGVTFRADLQWYVTPLLTLRAQARRDFRNSGARTVGGILTDTITLSAYYDPLRNLRLALDAGLERGDFGDVDTRTWCKSFRLRAQYRLNRSLSIGAYLGVLRQDVSGAPLVNPFTSFSAGLGVTITP